MSRLLKSICCFLMFFTFISHAQTNQNLSAKDWFNNGLHAYNIKTNAVQAVNCFTNALAINENYVPALLALGDLYAVRGEDAKAKQYFLHAIQDNRNSEYALRRLSDPYGSRTDTINEIKYLKEILPEISNNYLRLLIDDHISQKMFALGKTKEGGDYLKKLAPLTQWMIAGGFDNNERTGLKKTFPPEENLSLDNNYKGKEWKVNWRSTVPFAKYGNINFQFIRPANWITVYLRTGIIAPQQTSAVLHLSFPGTFRVWINGVPTAEYEKYCAYESYMYRIPVKLKSGTNFCVVKLCMENNGNDFFARLTSPDNSPLFLKNIQPDDKTIPLKCNETNRWPKPLHSPGIEYWKTICETNDNTLYAHVTLARYYRVARVYDKAIQHLEQLMNNGAAGAIDMYFLGRCYSYKDSDSQAVAAYRLAFASDPLAVKALCDIGNHYASRKIYDLAQPLFEQVLLINTNCFSARLDLIELYYSRDWDEDAYRLAIETCKLFPEYAESYRWLENASRSKNFMNAREKALNNSLKYQYNNNFDRFNLAQLFLYQTRFDEFFNQINIMQKLFPYDPDVLRLKLDAYISLRDITNSYKTCQQALAFFPDNFRFYKLLGDTYNMANERDNAINSYHDALKYSPDYLWLRQYLDFLEGRGKAFFDKFGLTQKQSDALIEKYKNIEQSSVEELSRILFRQYLVQVYADGSSRHMYHVICKVLLPNGVKKYSSIDLPGGRSSRLLRAVTHKKIGNSLEATHLDSGQIEFPNVQVEDIIEYKCMWDRYGSSWMDENFYISHTFDYNQSKIEQAEFAIALPTNRNVCIFTRPEDISCLTSNFESSFVWKWSFTNVPMYRSEPLSPPYYDLANRVSLSTITNWDMIVDWQRGMVNEIIKGDENMSKLARKITQNATSNLQKIELIFNYITENFRYTQMYENNIAKVKPHSIPDILANRCGDCKDLSLLMAEMLKSLNIPASTVLIRIASEGQIITNVPTPDVFNHAIVYIPGIGENGMFVDPTYRLGEYYLLPSEDQNVIALVINENDYKLLRTPLASPNESRSCDYINGEIFEDGTFTGSFKGVLWQNDAATFRRVLENLPKIRDLGSYLVGELNSSARLLDFEVENQKPHKHLPVIIDLTFSASQFGHISDHSITFSLPFPFESQEYLKGLETRKYPLKIKELGSQSSEYIFKIPDGYKINIAEKKYSLNTKFGTFVFNTNIEGTVLKINSEFMLTKQFIKVDEYPDFRDFLIKCSYLTSQIVTLQKK